MRISLYDYCVENSKTELLAQWDAEANLPMTPETVSYGSKYKAEWQCESGHRWCAQVWSRTTNHSDCPVCAGKTVVSGINDLKTKFPEIASQWHPTLNGTLTPEMVTCGSAKKVWWQCSEGHVWKAAIYSRTGVQKCGCPVCAGRVKKSKPYHYERIISDSEAKNVFEESSLNGFTR